MFSTKFDDLGFIIMRKRCSIQAGKKKITVDQSKVLKKKIDYSVYWGPPTNDKLMVNPENDCP